MQKPKYFPRYSLKVFGKGHKIIKRMSTKKKRRITLFLSGNHPRKASLYYVSVAYGWGLDVNGEKIVFDNSGDYKTKREALAAFRDFASKELVEHIRRNLV